MATDGNGDKPDDQGWIAELAARRDRSRAGPTPRGRSVSSALLLPPGVLPRDRRLRALLATIDGLHGAGELPQLPVRWGVLPLGFVALYRLSADHVDAISLTINPNRVRWALATVLEIGHFLDHRGIDPPSRFASASSDLLGE